MRRQLTFLCLSAAMFLYALPAMAVDVDVHMGAGGPSVDIHSSTTPPPPTPAGHVGHKPPPSASAA